MNRRGLLTVGGAAALAGFPGARVEQVADASGQPHRVLSADQFGAVGDGRADDAQALQAALDAVAAVTAEGVAGTLVIPPGTYRITKGLRVNIERNIGHHWGIRAHGARLLSQITDGGHVLHISCAGYARFLNLEGLDVLGSGQEGHGIYLECEHGDKALYNFALRDVVVQACGADGCRMIGNVFEGQVINSYFRKNKGNGITFGHGYRAGILSAIHVFACIFGDNEHHGAALINRCYDVSFHGCYLLLNGLFGLAADMGCTLLSNCGFENNHQLATGFDRGDAGIGLQNFGTLIGCTAYSVFNQTALVRAYIVSNLVMVGCDGYGDGRARDAVLAKIGGQRGAHATIIGCGGKVEYLNGFEGVEIGGPGGGVRLGSEWQSTNLPCLGDYRLWVDSNGRLRIKKGAPGSDEDGSLVGA